MIFKRFYENSAQIVLEMYFQKYRVIDCHTSIRVSFWWGCKPEVHPKPPPSNPHQPHSECYLKIHLLAYSMERIG